MCVRKVFLCQKARSDQNSWSEGLEARSEPLSWSMNETLCRDRAWRRGLSAIWGTDCWNGCSHWCKVHPLFGLLPDPASNQWLSQQTLRTLSSTKVEIQRKHLICPIWKQKLHAPAKSLSKKYIMCCVIEMKGPLCVCVGEERGRFAINITQS